VTISGGLNAGYGSTAGVATLTSNQAAANHVTFTSVEDLGGGLKASAAINVRFNPASGLNASNGTGTTALADNQDAFAQNVTLAISGGFGEIKAGRFTGIVQGPMGGYDPFGTDSNGVAMANPAVRSPGMVAYTSPAFSGFKVAIQTTLKDNNTDKDVATAATKDGTEVALTYGNGPISATLGNTTGVTGTKSTAIGASYNLGTFKPSLMNVKTETAAGVETTETAFGVSVPMGAATIKAGYKTTGSSTAGVADIKRTSLGVTYALSKRTSLIADTHKESGNATAATNKQAYYLGARHAF
jgi:predicted porin